MQLLVTELVWGLVLFLIICLHIQNGLQVDVSSPHDLLAGNHCMAFL